MLAEKRWRPESVLRLFMGLFGSFCVLLLLLQAWFRGVEEEWSESRFWFFTINTLLFHAISLGFVHRFLREEGTGWREAFGFRPGELVRCIILGAVACACVLPLTVVLGWLSSVVMQGLGEQPEAQQTIQTLQRTQTWVQRGAFGLVAIVFAPVVEELLFRGILFPTLREAGYPRIALWGSSIFFALTHANMMTMLPLTLLAVVLARLYQYSGNLLTPILTHAFFNAVNFTVLILELGRVPG